MLAFYMSLVDSEEEKNLVEELYKTNKHAMYSIAISCLHNHEEAEDAVHEAFLLAIKNIEKISSLPANKIAPYLNVIVRNVSYAVLIKRKPIADIDEDIIADDTSLEDKVITRIEREQLVRLARELPQGQMDVMTFRYYFGLNTSEIASALSISETAVRNRLFKAKRSLRKKLEEYIN